MYGALSLFSFSSNEKPQTMKNLEKRKEDYHVVSGRIDKAHEPPCKILLEQ